MHDTVFFRLGAAVGYGLAFLCKLAIYLGITYSFVDSVRHHHLPLASLTLLFVFWTWQRAVVMVGYLNTLHTFWSLPTAHDEGPTGIGPDGEWVYE